jgi:plasmid replication initiation protein
MPESQAEKLPFQLDHKLDSPLVGKAKNDRNLMVYNWFSLTRDKQTELPVYDDGRVRIEVTGTKHGVATIWDKEILIYLGSIIQDKINRGDLPSPIVSFTAHDLFRVTGTKAAGTAYDRLEDGLRRLKGTMISTNLETGGEGESGGFGWINDYKIQYRRGRGGEKVMKAIQVELSGWLYRAIVKDARMLTYDPQYFELGPIEKRLYEIARAHCGQQNGFKMNIEKLRLRVGTTQELRFFKSDLVKISKRRQPLPEFGLMVIDPRAKLVTDRKMPRPPGRTPVKAYMVLFFRSDRLAHMPTIDQAPLIDGELPESDL